MGQKVHPIGLRIGVIKDWQAKWYADKHYADFLQEDIQIRKAIEAKYPDAGISSVEIERGTNEVIVTAHTARPGIVIGRGGQRVGETRLLLEKLTGKQIRLNIQEIQTPELDAHIVAKNVARYIERNVAYRRVMKQAIFQSIQAGAQGVKITCSGRLAGVEIARRVTLREGRVPLHTLRADISYGFTEARTALGRIGVKVWIYRGDILPQPKVIEEAISEEKVEEPQEEASSVTAEESEI